MVTGTSSRDRRIRRVDVVVGILVTLILLVLLLPAIQKPEGNSNRLKCANNLKQIAIAFHNYASAYGTFPAGAISTIAGLPEDDPAPVSGNFTNWAIEILPYIEQDAIYKRYAHYPDATNEDNDRVRQQRVPTYECPTDADLELPENPLEGSGEHLLYARGSYRAVAGKSEDGETFWDEYSPKLDRRFRGVLHAVGIDPIEGGIPENNFVGERVTDLRDGSSHTLLIGEHAEIKHPRRRTFWAATDTYWNKSSITPQSRILGNDYDACVAKGGAGNELPCQRSFGSFHDGGMHFLLGDGSVRFVSYKASIDILAKMATMDGGEDVDVKELE